MPGGRYRGVLFLIFSLLGALTVTFMIYQLIQDARRGVVTQKPQTRSEVVVAAADIPPGWTIKSEHLSMRQLPETYIPDEVYRRAEDVVGRVAMERILGGEFIREERLADPEAGTGLPAIIPRGMRALQVPVKNASAVSGFVEPGNFVDVVAVCTATKPPEVRTLLQAVTILAVNDRMTDAAYYGRDRAQRRVAPSVTMALTPQDAEKVKHAFASCRITLTLRNDIDVTNIDSNDRGEIGPADPAAAPSDDGAGMLSPADATPRDHRILRPGSSDRHPYASLTSAG
ncbi:MAG: Flp pilus assembly protein CpaB [Alphaproteobacteria bacterium]|nr:Flp pilus assembly protein CpaB [Alphaproteobacteria bacterium]